MPSELIRCPSCARDLRLPDHLLGRRVKCPTCQATFTAAAPAPTTPPAREPEPEPYRAEPAPARRRPRFEYDEDDDWEDEDDRPRRRRRSGRRRGREAVMPPAIALLVAGVLGILVAIGHLGVNLANDPFQRAKEAAAARPGGTRANEAFRVGFIGGAVGCPIIGFFWAVIVSAAAASMLGLRSREFAVTGCIVAMLPCCNFLWFLGLPFGIWALVTLNRPDVRRAFDR
jgi:hypothetical protein